MIVKRFGRQLLDGALPWRRAYVVGRILLDQRRAK